MILVEQHIINKNHSFFNECDSLCLKSKNLYNLCLYTVRQAYIKDKVNLLYSLHDLMKNKDEYKSLPAKVSSAVLLMVQKNFKSFFKSLSDFYKNPNKYKSRPKLPYYLDKENGRYFTSYTNQAISKKIFKKSNKISLSKTNIEFKTKITDFNSINGIRIIPKLSYYVIEVIYTITEQPKLIDNKQYIGIDLGLNNLATLTSNVKNFKPIIINGKPLKSMNQYYNKKVSYLKSILEKRNNKKVSKQLNKLHLKRKNKIDNYLHKSSKFISEFCNKNNVNTLIVGQNKEWKQDINIGLKNNQNFVNIPHSRFIEMLKYKCEKIGINFIITDESYTSKCSFLDNEVIEKHEQYKGKRIKRGLFKSSDGTLINSDVNGSYNIMKKVIPNLFKDGIEGYGVNPIVITL